MFAVFSANWAGADTASQLDAAKNRLSSLLDDIEAENAQLASLRGELNVLAGKIDTATDAFQQTQVEVTETRDDLEAARDRYETLRSRLDDRAADAYMEGPGSGLDALLGSATISDFSDRFEFLDSVAQHDTDLANNVQNLASQLHQLEVVLNKILDRQAGEIRRFNDARAQLDAKFNEEQEIREDLQAQQAEVQGLVEKYKKQLEEEERQRALALAAQTSGVPIDIANNPLHVCPVGDPHAFGDSFGAPRYAGGYHPHAGNDIMAPRGTPIYATFDGVAEEDANGLGGNAVIVKGAEGYTYNAHLDSYGQLGSVTAGTVIGYVGDSGDALGGPTHDHFEWHPYSMPSPLFQSAYGYTEINGAIDPYPYLLQVC